MKQRFFGHPESPLFGVLHAARGRSRNDQHAVVICPPIGQEYNRTHWMLRLMANQISRGGINVLRMDYHGIGDSSQTIEQVDSLETWTRNIEQSIDHLKNETGAKTVMLVGLRFGASLAALTAMQRPDVNSVVLWEPILNGQRHLQQLRELHRNMIDLRVTAMETPNDQTSEELLGSRYDRRLLNEIERTKIVLATIVQPQLIIAAESERDRYAAVDPSQQKVMLDPQPQSWQQLRDLETAWLRPMVQKKVVKLIDDMFRRLQRFDALQSPKSRQSETQTLLPRSN